MPDNDTNITADQICKYYHLWENPVDRIKAPLWRQIAKTSMVPGPIARMIDRRAARWGREVRALGDISFQVKRGESFGIIGRNGAGKSTLLQVLAGTLTATSGTVRVKGRVAALLELGSAFSPEFTGRENIYIQGAIFGLSKKEIIARFDEVAEFAGIGEFIEYPVKTYSSGMAVRLIFASQILLDPDIFIVDEALAVGDVYFKAKCNRFFEEKIAKGMTLILVTHDLSTVKAMCSRTLLLNEGRLAFLGDSDRAVSLFHELHNKTNGAGPGADKIEPFSRTVSLPGDADPRNWDTDDEVGSREAEFVYCEILNAEGNPCRHFSIGERIFVRLYVQAREHVDGAHVDFQLTDAYNKVVYGIGSYILDNPYKNLEPGNLYTCFINLGERLGEGDYLLDVQLRLGDRGDSIAEHIIHRVGSIAAIQVRRRGPRPPFVGSADLGAKIAWD